MQPIQFNGYYVVKTYNEPWSSNAAHLYGVLKKEGFTIENSEITTEQWDSDNRLVLQLPDVEDERFESFLSQFKSFPIEAVKPVGKEFASFKEFFKNWGEKVSLPRLK